MYHLIGLLLRTLRPLPVPSAIHRQPRPKSALNTTITSIDGTAITSHHLPFKMSFDTVEDNDITSCDLQVPPKVGNKDDSYRKFDGSLSVKKPDFDSISAIEAKRRHILKRVRSLILWESMLTDSPLSYIDFKLIT